MKKKKWLVMKEKKKLETEQSQVEKKDQPVGRLGKFVLVSIGGLVINQIIIFVCITLLDLFYATDLLFTFWLLKVEKPLVAAFIAIIFVTTYNYTINKFWTFKQKEKRVEFNIYTQFIKFALVGASGTLVNLGLVYILYTLLKWNKYIATALAFIASVINNFIWDDRWTFNPKYAKKKRN